MVVVTVPAAEQGGRLQRLVTASLPLPDMPHLKRVKRSARTLDPPALPITASSQPATPETALASAAAAQLPAPSAPIDSPASVAPLHTATEEKTQKNSREQPGALSLPICLDIVVCQLTAPPSGDEAVEEATAAATGSEPRQIGPPLSTAALKARMCPKVCHSHCQSTRSSDGALATERPRLTAPTSVYSSGACNWTCNTSILHGLQVAPGVVNAIADTAEICNVYIHWDACCCCPSGPWPLALRWRRSRSESTRP